jgi:hypothetical protein
VFQLGKNQKEAEFRKQKKLFLNNKNNSHCNN